MTAYRGEEKMEDLVKRLRDWEWSASHPSATTQLYHEAADEIERLRQALTVAREQINEAKRALHTDSEFDQQVNASGGGT
jgi:hypothetical protein